MVKINHASGKLKLAHRFAKMSKTLEYHVCKHTSYAKLDNKRKVGQRQMIKGGEAKNILHMEKEGNTSEVIVLDD